MQNYLSTLSSRPKGRSKFKNLIYCGFLFVIFIFSFLFFILDKAEASALSLGIDPPITIINILPPATATSVINIQNKSDLPITLQIQLKPFKAKGENGELEYLGEIPEIFKNIQILDNNIPVESIILGPKQQKSLTLNVNLPNESETNQAGVAGEVGRDYYFSALFVSTDSPQIESSSSINQIGIATNVLLSVGILETPKLTLEEFSTNIFFDKGPVLFTVRVKNTDTHFAKPTGEISIKNMFGQNIGKLVLSSVNVLSGSIRTIPNETYMQELRLKDNSGIKVNNSLDFKYPIALWKESFLLGLYTATLNISVGGAGPMFTKTIYFFAFPFQILIIIVLIIIAAIVVINRLKFYMNKDRTGA